MIILGTVAVTLVAAVLPTLTAVGARRRGQGLAGALLAGVLFPVTWTVWYLRDEHPYQPVSRHR